MGGVRAQSSDRRYKGQTRSQVVERRATYVIEVWADRATIEYPELQAEVMRVFECGSTAAQHAIKRAGERMREAYRQDDPELAALKAARIEAAYWRQYEEADREKKRRDATRALDSLRAMGAHGAPDRVQVTTTSERTTRLKDLTLEQLRALAAVDEEEAAPIAAGSDTEQ